MRTVHARVSPATQRQISDIGYAARGGVLDTRKGPCQSTDEFLDGEGSASRAPLAVNLVAVSFHGQSDRAQQNPVRMSTPRQADSPTGSKYSHATRKQAQRHDGKRDCLPDL